MLLDLYIETNFHDFLFLLVKHISNQQGCDDGNNCSKRVGHQSAKILWNYIWDYRTEQYEFMICFVVKCIKVN
ncbi:unnamed protein product [Malus baccata var. baccata]|uniref:Uncharacterized protein n=1 Tax=Malus domestica TaxID=3750 RepID=A0A498I916_MALDO|nr:hypothetical protein DVH24_001995 [Malus domestica]